MLPAVSVTGQLRGERRAIAGLDNVPRMVSLGCVVAALDCSPYGLQIGGLAWCIPGSLHRASFPAITSGSPQWSGMCQLALSNPSAAEYGSTRAEWPHLRSSLCVGGAKRTKDERRAARIAAPQDPMQAHIAVGWRVGDLEDRRAAISRATSCVHDTLTEHCDDRPGHIGIHTRTGYYSLRPARRAADLTEQLPEEWRRGFAHDPEPRSCVIDNCGA